ncbi:hypothetical protein [Adhaeretor mobilis]|uniref:Uncharacterized protein n=1 Tax=Adhaeretor mobilis TaxID=1930276 RepID=A0A517N380_9BACT|nr:hypothetical protein [Adhaeretor mobilis]QDT01438.1 hypothetical protein HG15A2_47800 [Adhaeretor mobilis]
MRRFLITLLTVCCLAGVVQQFENGDRLRAAGDSWEFLGYGIATLGPSDWIRTSDGWERREVLFRQPQVPLPTLPHPGLIAAFQIGLSLFALIAFPSPVKLLAISEAIPSEATPSEATPQALPLRSGKRRIYVSRKTVAAS